jgi:hypothetical protein
MRSRALVIIPAYNEAKTIAAVVRGLREAAPNVDRLIVTDGSSDGTPDVVRSLGERHLEMICNVGYGRVLQTGFQYAVRTGYEVIVTIDGDGQHDPRDVPRLLEALDSTGVDLVIGSRFVTARRYSGPTGRQVGQWIFSVLTGLLGQRIYDTTSGLKAWRAPACEATLEGRFLDFHTEVLVRLRMLGFRITELGIVVEERTSGTSMYSLVGAVAYPVKTFLLMITGMLDVKLRGQIK